MKTDGARVVARLEEIYRCGELGDGSHSRLAFSEEDRKGREAFARRFRALGIEPSVDPAGNMIARLEGREPLPAIVVGSHLDTVPDGGKYDGALGCVAGLEVVETLLASGTKLRHPLEVVVFSDEEGARFGSGMIGSSAFSGASLANFSLSAADKEGIRRRDALAAWGLNVNDGDGIQQLSKAARGKETVHCCLELHIEQGGGLFKAQVPIGVVTTIAGVKRCEIVTRGQMNHAGSTSMEDRKDALVAAARFIASVPDVARAHGGQYSVATVGAIAVSPNAVNVIPGSCTFSLEIRDREPAVMERIEGELRRVLARVAEGFDCDFRPISSNAPVSMDPGVQNAIAEACEDEGCPYRLMPSGAFHDSLMLAEAFPCGMIFIPSVDGVSHSPEEFSREEDIQRGCDVLLRSVLRLDARFEP
ncbi:MAG: Zn-dependent hydrolase [Synergistaceae bacterium]|jgi:allantoate deiminase/N-carbamoyl-L-amino-acid hydrolase|nr:Zn-dependent hydrolase [Synergistaceae bacterium]